jgi:ABC-type multidrug transport system ATPase subunit/ABC-type multidrug transport system permease subunit
MESIMDFKKYNKQLSAWQRRFVFPNFIDETAENFYSGRASTNMNDGVAMESSWNDTSITLVNAQNETGVWLCWDDLKVQVDISNGICKTKLCKHIIHSSRGRARPGEVLAVMGPSGAGKTSLFNSLAKRGTGYHVQGSLTLNGKSYNKEDLISVAGFVFQEAVFHSHITTEEALRTAASLKLPSSLTKDQKEHKVQVLLDAFDLRKCARTKIGDSKVKGISGGEKKRLSIAIEVLTGPSLLFLDEPTSGLDSASSLMIVKLLCDLADVGTTVILVLHQPRASILTFIDRFLILSDGRDVFYGNMQNMIQFFEHVEMPIPLRTNPLDFVLDVINTNDSEIALGMESQASHSFAEIMRSASKLRQKQPIISTDGALETKIRHLDVDRKQLAHMLSCEYRKFGLFEKLCCDDPDMLTLPSIQTSAQQGSSVSTRLVALLHREFTQKLRNPEVHFTQVGGATILGLVMGSIYYQLSPTQVFDKTAALSFGALMCMFMVFHLILLFPVERNIWLRDRDNGLYTSGEYYASIVLAGMPGDIISCFILSSILYWMFGLQPSATHFFTFLGFMVLTICCANSMMLLGGAIAPSPSVATSLVSLILLFVMLFNGFFITFTSIPPWYKWIAEINFMRFSISGLCWNEFHGQVYNCTVGTNCLFGSGDAVLLSLSIPVDLQLWRMAVYMLIVIFVFHILAFLAVTFCYTGALSEVVLSVKRRCMK